ncbi:MAG TPA: glycosyltransferase family 2 protein [Candidatus Saccharimonadales bacterium]
MAKESGLISYVVPAYNEQASVRSFYVDLVKVVERELPGYKREIIFVDDGSTDKTLSLLTEIATHDTTVRVMSLSRNFGKELALTAGITAAEGDAIMTLDADGQFPAELIPEFVKHWQDGADVVIGVRTSNANEGLVKRYGSKLFYKIINAMPDVRLTPGASDFRLIDREVQAEFIRCSERNRIARGLIDWLGFEHHYVHFAAKARAAGEAPQTFRKLFALSIDSLISLSRSPLYFAAYLGAIIVPCSLLLLLAMVLNQLFGDRLHLHVTGSAYVVVGLTSLVGVLLISQGILGIYLSSIHAETQGRPLYVVNKRRSVNLKK